MRGLKAGVLGCAGTMLISAAAASAGFAQTVDSAISESPTSQAEAAAAAQRAYDIAVATAEAQRRYDLAIATAEAQRKYEISKVKPQIASSPGEAPQAVPPNVPRLNVPPGDPLPPSASDANKARLEEIGASRCKADATSAEAIARDPNRYARECLLLERWADYTVAGLNANLSLGAVNDVAEVLGTYSIYKRQPRGSNAGEFSFTRWQFRGGPIVPLDKSGGTTAAFANLTEAQAFKRVGGLLGIEWRTGTKSATSVELTSQVQKMLVKAQRDCEEARRSTDLKLAGGGTIDGVDPAPEGCLGSSLQQWMAADKTKARSNTYWSMVADDVWGRKPKSELFVGVEGRLLPYQLKYVPLRDPANTGDSLLTGSPFDVAGTIPDANNREFDRPRYSIRMYGGGVEGLFGWGGSLTYRRTIDQPKGTKDVTLCPPSAAASVCTVAQIARPYESEGWVVGGRMAGMIPRFAFLPETGIELRVSYATDLNQIGFDAPLYLLADKDGKATGGLRVGCTGDGKTSSGFVIKGECKATIFIGTSFALRGAP